MTTYGVTSAGFVAKTMDVIVADLESAIKATFGFMPRGLLKKLVAIIAERFTELWELAELAFTAMDPDSAVDTLQDALGALIGTLRQEAVATAVTLTCCGDPTTLITTGKQAKTAVTSDVFATTADATITALAAWVSGHGYTAGDRVTNASRAYVCRTSGTSAGSGGPTTTADDITDNTAHWRYMGEGTGAVDVAAACTETGPVEVFSGDITGSACIVTPVSGWLSVKNLLDGETGRDVESNEAFRIRRELELSAVGETTPDAIRADLLELTGVVSATVFWNPTDVTDVDGIPPHAVECLVRGGTDQAIADLLLQRCIAAGINTQGTSSASSVDSEGTSHTMKFTRPTLTNIYVVIALNKDTGYPSDGTTQVKNAIVAFGDKQKGGKDATASGVSAQCFTVAGVDDVTECSIYTDVIGTASAWTATHGYVATPGARDVVTNDGGRKYICITAGTSAGSGGPTGTGTDITDGTVHWRFLGATIPISTRELAVFDTSRISVTASTVTP